jgi:hypothetical protein
MKHKGNGAYPSDSNPTWAGRLSDNAKGTPTYREKVEELDRQRARAHSQDQFVRLGHDMLGSPAWRALGPKGQAAYIRYAKRYRPARKDKKTGAPKPSNNGKIQMAVRELAREMDVADDTANKQQRRLEAFGFIAATVKGWRGPTHQASTWRLTEYGTNDRPLATRDFLDIEESDFERIEKSLLRPKKQDGPSYDLGRPRPKKSDTTSSCETKAPENLGKHAGDPPYDLGRRRHEPSYDLGHSIDDLPGASAASVPPTASKGDPPKERRVRAREKRKMAPKTARPPT